MKGLIKKLRRRQVSRLPASERVIVIGCRRYLLCRQRAGVDALCRECLGAAAAGAVASALIAALDGYFRAYRLTPMIGKEKELLITRDESLLLQGVRHYQAGQTAQGACAAALLVAAPETAAFERVLASLAVALTATNVPLSRPIENAHRGDLQTPPGVDEIQALTRSEALLVCAIRSRALACRQGRHGGVAARDFFREHRLARAARPFNAAMKTLNVAALRTIDVRCPPCARLSSDEARLLAATALRQYGISSDGTDAALTVIIVPAGVPVLSDQLGELASVLRDAGHWLPLRVWSFAEPEAPAARCRAARTAA